MTATSEKPASRRVVKGSHVLAAFVAFFLVIVAADATMIYAAISTFGGVDNKNAYRDGLAYNTRIARAEQQSETGWRAELEVTASPARLRLSMVDRDGAAVPGLDVAAKVTRPATNRYDAAIGLAETAPGIYEAPVADREPGSWIVAIAASERGNNGVAFEMRRRLWLKP
jgi:nitrogen fixation protein FixH